MLHRNGTSAYFSSRFPARIKLRDRFQRCAHKGSHRRLLSGMPHSVYFFPSLLFHIGLMSTDFKGFSVVCQVPGWPAGTSFFSLSDRSPVFPAAGLQPVLIFLLGSQAAADVALRLIDVQHHPCLGRQSRVDVGEAVGDVFMHRTLRYSKLFRCLPHRSILVYDVIGDLDRPFFDIFLHGSSPGNVLYII